MNFPPKCYLVIVRYTREGVHPSPSGVNLGLKWVKLVGHLANSLPLTDRGISELFRFLQKRTGIDGKCVSPHNCRRYMATTQLASGRSPFDVQRQMGHTTLTMTNHYASLNVKQLQQSHDLYSPLRAKETGSEGESSGTGYWDIE